MDCVVEVMSVQQTSRFWVARDSSSAVSVRNIVFFNAGVIGDDDAIIQRQMHRQQSTALDGTTQE